MQGIRCDGSPALVLRYITASLSNKVTSVTGSLYTKDRYRSFASLSLSSGDAIGDGDAAVALCAGDAFDSGINVALFVFVLLRSSAATPPDEPIPPPKIVINSRIIGTSLQRMTIAIKMAGTRAATQTMPNRRRISHQMCWP